MLMLSGCSLSLPSIMIEREEKKRKIPELDKINVKIQTDKDSFLVYVLGNQSKGHSNTSDTCKNKQSKQ